MARVTVEDCLDYVENRFQLVLLSAKRARHLMESGEEPTVPWDNDKATVVALREISAGHLDSDYLLTGMVKSQNVATVETSKNAGLKSTVISDVAD